MKEIIERYRNVVIQIATPYSTETGFYLKSQGVINTNEHVVSNNRAVVVDGSMFEKQLVGVVYTDRHYDLVFGVLSDGVNIPEVELGSGIDLRQGDQVLAVGHPLGLEYSVTQEVVFNIAHYVFSNDAHYIQHDAALNPGNSGGTLISNQGCIIGLNPFVLCDGSNIGFSLPAKYFAKVLEEAMRRPMTTTMF